MEQGALNFAGERKVWTVSALLTALKKTLERDYFDAWIEGEISNLHVAATKHCYFTLKDSNGQLRCAMFASQARLLRFRLGDGMQVRVRGRISVFEARGELQCYVEHAEPLGRGELQAAFEQLKAKLESEGLFEAARKRPLPRLPRRIGLITSARGAAVADMIRVLRRRYANLEILLYPVAVQGEAAAGEIAGALNYFAQNGHGLDVLIVGRGGGSLEDLWPFNTEVVARALARSPIPTISAVGHETDFTIADFVADMRAPTPSAAAEMAVRPKSEFEREQEALRRHLEQAVRYRLLDGRKQLADLTRHRVFYAVRQRMSQRGQRLDEMERRLEGGMRQGLARARRRLSLAAARAQQHDARAALAQIRNRLEARRQALAQRWHAAASLRRQQLARLHAQLEERNPLGILRRGYTLTYDAEGRLATSPEHFAEGDGVRVRFAAGWLEAEARKGNAG